MIFSHARSRLIPFNQAKFLDTLYRSNQCSGSWEQTSAALIYKSLGDYYEFVLESGATHPYGPDCTKAALARCRTIAEGLPDLFDALRGALSGAPVSLALVEAIASC
jgi:hypothetical protein